MHIEYTQNTFSDIHMPTSATTSCGEEHAFDVFLLLTNVRNSGDFHHYLSSVPLYKTHRDSSIIHPRVEVNLTLGTRGLVEAHIEGADD